MDELEGDSTDGALVDKEMRGGDGAIVRNEISELIAELSELLEILPNGREAELLNFYYVSHVTYIWCWCFQKTFLTQISDGKDVFEEASESCIVKYGLRKTLWREWEILKRNRPVTFQQDLVKVLCALVSLKKEEDNFNFCPSKRLHCKAWNGHPLTLLYITRI